MVSPLTMPTFIRPAALLHFRIGVPVGPIPPHANTVGSLAGYCVVAVPFPVAPNNRTPFDAAT